MPRKTAAEDLSADELRRLLVEKRRTERRARLEHFRRTGRVMVVEPDADSPSLLDLSAEVVEEESEEEQSRRTRRRRQNRRWIDRLLFLVEAGAVVGLLFVLFNGVNLLRDLNKEIAAGLQQPTLTPTALIQAVVLPSGHTPPDSAGGAQPNDAEIPEHLRPLVQSLANLPIPTAGPEQAKRIQIPSINVDAPVVIGDGWEQLKKGVAQHIGSADPGLAGNVVLSAHNDIFGEIFRDLDKIKQGDQILLYTNQRVYHYVVTGTQIVAPTQVDVMGATTDATVTLISCYPYMVDNQRIVVSATLQEKP